MAILEAQGVRHAVIGALAVAAHGYPRDTQDLDIATEADPFGTLGKVTEALQTAGFNAELITPDSDDPLGRVINISGEDHDDIQIVNFWNPLRPSDNPGGEAIQTAVAAEIAGEKLQVVDLAHLVALKLYAGGPKSIIDIVELLTRNPSADRVAIRGVCARFGLASDFDAVCQRVGPGSA